MKHPTFVLNLDGSVVFKERALLRRVIELVSTDSCIPFYFQTAKEAYTYILTLAHKQGVALEGLDFYPVKETHAEYPFTAISYTLSVLTKTCQTSLVINTGGVTPIMEDVIKLIDDYLDCSIRLLDDKTALEWRFLLTELPDEVAKFLMRTKIGYGKDWVEDVTDDIITFLTRQFEYRFPDKRILLKQDILSVYTYLLEYGLDYYRSLKAVYRQFPIVKLHNNSGRLLTFDYKD